MKSLAEYNKMRMMDYVKATWYFEKPHEKIILIVLSLLGILRIIQWLFNFGFK